MEKNSEHIGEKPAKYTARLNSEQRFSPEFLDFLNRRTLPFLDRVGLDKPISLLLQEAYLQGLKDAVDAMTPVSDGIR